MQREPLGGVVVTSSFDYLNSAINRPDIFADQTTLKSGITKSLPRSTNVVVSIMTVILSAFIFVTIVGWFTVLQSYYDSIFVNTIISSLVRSRIYYAATATGITIIAFFIFFMVYQYMHKNVQ